MWHHFLVFFKLSRIGFSTESSVLTQRPDAGDCLRVRGECPEAVFCANTALLVPLSSLLRRLLVLAASHASVQWFLLESLSKMFEKLGLCLVMFSNLLSLFPLEGILFPHLRPFLGCSSA